MTTATGMRNSDAVMLVGDYGWKTQVEVHVNLTQRGCGMIGVYDIVEEKISMSGNAREQYDLTRAQRAGSWWEPVVGMSEAHS